MSCLDLVLLLIEIPSPTVRKKILRNLNICRLLILLNGLAKDEKNDDFLEFDELKENFKPVWTDVVDVLNNFPCVKLVDSYTKASSDETDGLGWFDLPIDSNEYDFLLEYLLDSKVNRIIFPLVEVMTKKYNKIHEVLENHCVALKIRNDNLSVIKDSENLKSKLRILTLVNYEHFETVEKLKYETLNIIGNEVDLFSVSTMIKKNENLKIIYFKGRLKDYIPLHIDDKMLVYYELIVFDTIDNSQLSDLGSLARIKSLYSNFTLESNVSLDWLLKNCTQMKRLCYSLNFSTNLTQTLTFTQNHTELEELTLKRCKFSIQNNGDKRSKLSFSQAMNNAISNLHTLTLIECEIDSEFLDAFCGPSLMSIFLINCNIKFKSFVKLPVNLRNLTIINQDVDKCKNLVLMTFKKRSSFILSSSRKCMLNINEKILTMKIPESHDAFIARLDSDYSISSAESKNSKDSQHEKHTFNVQNLRIPYSSTVHFAIYPNFDPVDFKFLKILAAKFDIFQTIIELYSFTNTFHDVRNVQEIQNVKVHRYDIFRLQSHLKKILAKKVLTEQDNKFFSPYPCTCESPLRLSPASVSSAARKLRSPRSPKKPHSLALKALNTVNIRVARTNTKSQNGKVKSHYTCDICGKHFSRSTALNRHALVHKNFRPYKCEGCGYCFKRSDHLKVHKRVCTFRSGV
ncbi:hypothetical protein PMKS-000995 [Pichia membranifaciens]|uniref:C2H2-type domain-containing protein n=1 Tax=Pichia membranifaciens TaxID=4926 RepID=A0A1Q2YD96_9ASCO|nr:hypothetical protein PMKS-000995 [Pichia membranifaciens]